MLLRWNSVNGRIPRKCRNSPTLHHKYQYFGNDISTRTAVLVNTSSLQLGCNYDFICLKYDKLQPSGVTTGDGYLRFQQSVKYSGVILYTRESQDSPSHDRDSKLGEAALLGTVSTWSTGMGIPGSNLHLHIQGVLPKDLCISSEWLSEKTLAS